MQVLLGWNGVDTVAKGRQPSGGIYASSILAIYGSADVSLLSTTVLSSHPTFLTTKSVLPLYDVIICIRNTRCGRAQAPSLNVQIAKATDVGNAHSLSHIYPTSLSVYHSCIPRIYLIIAARGPCRTAPTCVIYRMLISD